MRSLALALLMLSFATAAIAQTPPPGTQAAPTPAPVGEVVAGPMVGHVWDSGVRIWYQFDRAGRIGVEARPAGSSGEWIPSHWKSGEFRDARVTSDVQFTGSIELGGLAPRTTYEYRLLFNKQPIAPAGEQTFRTTAPAGEPEDFRAAFGSCAGSWGRDPNSPIFHAIDRMHPDAFLFLGDNVYYERDNLEWADPMKMWARYKDGRALPSLQGLIRRTAMYSIWDDHDYGPDDSNKIYTYKDLSLSIFRAYWANPTYGSDGTPGIWTRFTRGRVEFFLLDGRYYRDDDDAPNDEFKTQWGDTQKRWLEKVLRASQADFKVILNGGQFLARYHEYESFELYHADRDWLIGLIRSARIPGVVFLSGDRHIGEAIRWQPPEAPYPFYDFTSSPLSAGVGAAPPDGQVAERIPGTLVMTENFGMLTFSKMDSDPTLTFQLYGVDEKPLGKAVEVKAKDLRMP